jgi:hypothetical protein
MPDYITAVHITHKRTARWMRSAGVAGTIVVDAKHDQAKAFWESRERAQ